MPHDSRTASARLVVGDGPGVGLYLAPVAVPVTQPGRVILILGATPSGLPVKLDISAVEWLDDLEEAVRETRKNAGQPIIIPLGASR